jgi:hypothetical protein
VALATLRYRKLGCNFLKPSDFEDISVSKISHFAQGAGLLKISSRAAQKSITVEVHGSFGACPSVFYSIPGYRVL